MPDQSRRDDSQYDSMDVEATILEIPGTRAEKYDTVASVMRSGYGN